MHLSACVHVCVYVRVHVYIHVCVCLCHGMHTEVTGQLMGSQVLSFHHVCTGNQSQVIKLGGKCLYLLTHPRGPTLTDSNQGEGDPTQLCT